MELVRGYHALARALTRPVVTIGNFDGVHAGHRRIVELTLEKARARGGAAVAYTFRPHPQVALRPEANVPLLSTYDEKLELLQAAGLDVVIEEPFSREFSTTSAEEFFTDVLLRRIGAEAVVIGYDFAFGKGRQGHLEALSAFCKQTGVELTVVPPLRVDGEIVSSSRIRQHLGAGEVDVAAHLLGREFFYRGVVIRGDGRGRKIGFPTANLSMEHLEQKLALPYGVYATRVVLEGETIDSVTNVGVRPTFQGSPPLIETHLLDRDVDLYGRDLEVRFVRRLREEKKFQGIGELKAQIAEDVVQARRILKAQ
jgi:riboflavin kinase/FMN adenylyltransferase